MLYQPHSQLRWLCLSRNLIIKPRCSEASKLDARLSLLFISKMLHHRHLRDSCTDFLSMLIYRVLLLAFSIQSSLLLMAQNLFFEKVFFIYFLHLVVCYFCLIAFDLFQPWWGLMLLGFSWFCKKCLYYTYIHINELCSKKLRSHWLCCAAWLRTTANRTPPCPPTSFHFWRLIPLRYF